MIVFTGSGSLFLFLRRILYLPFCAHLVKKIMDEREHPELGYRSCLGIMRLEKKYSKKRLENACKRALKVGALEELSQCEFNTRKRTGSPRGGTSERGSLY